MTIERIDARDVLDPNAKTTKGFLARVLGRFVRVGPDNWDPYIFKPTAAAPEETIKVLADVPVQLEVHVAQFRMRRHGQVLRLAWLPTDADCSDETNRLARFMAECVRPWGESTGIGAAAVIAEKLTSKPSKPSLD
jgi:hypothetical protein